MKALNPTTLADAGMKIAPALGLTWPDDRAEIVLAVNQAREEIYNRYDQYRLFDNVERCFCLSTFTTGCFQTECCQDNTWRGITLPNDMVGISQAFVNRVPARLNSRWRETAVGTDPKPADEVQLVRQPGDYCTEEDFTPGVLTFNIMDVRDVGKTVQVRGYTPNGDEITVNVELLSTGAQTEEVFAEITSLSFSGQRYGAVALSVDGVTISRYAPREMIPCYTRYKLGGVCHAEQILVFGIRKYEDIYFDDDIVEIGSRLVLDGMGRWFRYRNSRDKEELNVGAIGLREALNHVSGIIKRHNGNSLEDSNVFNSYHGRKERRVKTLPKYRR
jgi:hypothetical protein